MALPDGITKCLVTFGPYIDFQGAPIKGEVTITPSTSLYWSNNPTPIMKKPIPIQLNARGEGDVDLPHVDQAGFTNSAGVMACSSSNTDFRRGTRVAAVKAFRAGTVAAVGLAASAVCSPNIVASPTEAARTTIRLCQINGMPLQISQGAMFQGTAMRSTQDYTRSSIFI